MERRGLLKRLVAGAAFLAAGAIPYVVSSLLAPGRAASGRNYLRPPGALKDDAAFVAACIGCGLCGEVCPPRCIRFHDRDGGGKVNTPYIDAENKACILCNKCMEACPTEALVVTSRDRIDMGVARIDRTACYPWVDRGVCGACVSICPLGDKAIVFKMWNQYRPVIKQGCVGCGLCVEVCPHPSKPIWVVDRMLKSASKPAVSRTMRVMPLALLALFFSLLPLDFAAAHHVLGRPAYSLNEDSNTPPSMQAEIQIGDYMVTYMVFPAFPRPEQPGRINFYATRIDDGTPFQGKVTFRVRADSWFSWLGIGDAGEKLGVQLPDDNVFRQRYIFHAAGDYIISAAFEADGEPYDIGFPLRIGEPAPVGPVGIVIGLVMIVLVGVSMMQRRRSMTGRIRGVHDSKHPD